MFYISKDQELTTELLQKMISKFLTDVQPKLKKSKDYYNGKMAILEKSYADSSKPCSRTVINYCSNIANSYCGYLASPSYISYSSENDIEPIMEVLRYNDYQAQDSEFLLNALIYGKANELMYIDSAGKTRFKQINPAQSFGIYDDSLSGDLLYFVRFYEDSQWDDSDLFNVDVYSDTAVKHYTMHGENSFLTAGETEPHYFSQCPANIFVLPEEQSIFECIIGLQDAANELLSCQIDDYSAFVDAYLVFTGGEITPDDAKSLEKGKEKRTLNLPEGVTAEFLTKNITGSTAENILKRVHDSIYRVAQCPDFSSESFVSGVSSGIAIRYRLTGMETRAAKICAEMKKALQRRIEIISGIASLKLGEDVFRDIEISFKRNIPEDISATVNLINTLKGTVSDRTLLGQIPFVSDVNAELEAVKEQKQENMSLYPFASLAASDEESEDADE
jgi:SPP1 family phage portal protein